MLNFDKFYMTSPASAGLFAFWVIRESPLQGYLTLWRRWGWGPASRDSYCLEQRSSSPYKDRSSCKGERFLFFIKVLEGVWGNFSKEVPPHRSLYFNKGFKNLPVYEFSHAAICSGVPVATTVPPPSPPSGPRSMM